MSLHTALAASATLVSLAFAFSTLERWLARRRRHEGAWTISLFLFAAGSAALWVGAAVGWDEWSFKAFYLFGAILNVPFLALGTVELLAGPTHGRRWTAIVSLLAAFCTGLVVSAPLVSFIDPDVLPQGKDVFGAGPRIAAALASGVGAMVIFGGAVWSAWRLVQGRRRPGTPSALPAGRLALANLFIAVGTLVLSAGGILNSVVNEMDGFAISLVVGISIIFVGFLMTSTGGASAVRALPEPRAWHAHTAQVAAAVLVAVSLAAAPLVLDDRPAAAAGGEVSDYLGRINATRAAAGVPALRLDPQLSGLAQAWAGQLASWGRLQHAVGPVRRRHPGVAEARRERGAGRQHRLHLRRLRGQPHALRERRRSRVHRDRHRRGPGCRREAVHRAAVPRPLRIPRWDLRRRLGGRLRRPRTHHDHDATSAAATTPSATRAPRPRGPDPRRRRARRAPAVRAMSR